jgi:hypothetical protein
LGVGQGRALSASVRLGPQLSHPTLSTRSIHPGRPISPQVRHGPCRPHPPDPRRRRPIRFSTMVPSQSLPHEMFLPNTRRTSLGRPLPPVQGPWMQPRPHFWRVCPSPHPGHGHQPSQRRHPHAVPCGGCRGQRIYAPSPQVRHGPRRPHPSDPRRRRPQRARPLLRPLICHVQQPLLRRSGGELGEGFSSVFVCVCVCAHGRVHWGWDGVEVRVGEGEKAWGPRLACTNLACTRSDLEPPGSAPVSARSRRPPCSSGAAASCWRTSAPTPRLCPTPRVSAHVTPIQ